MKYILKLIFLSGFIPITHSQELNSVNSGSYSFNNLIYSVGEVYVIPSNKDKTSAGIIGAVSTINNTTLGIDDYDISQKIKYFPNPTNQSLFINSNEIIIKELSLFDINGRLIATKKVINNQINLENLQAGIYFIKTDNPKVQAFKIIKK